jgi:hypothetical protein
VCSQDRVGKRKTRDQATDRRASPRMVTAWQNRDVNVELMRGQDGPGIDVEDCAPNVRRCSIVKEGLARQKMMAGACGI